MTFCHDQFLVLRHEFDTGSFAIIIHI